jgi:NAD(P)-dependent dehydrogenase (short-subunit alcohol dehydrogenase family)
VTGAGKGVGEGIGKGTVKVLAEAGATVVGTARTEWEMVDTIKAVETSSGGASYGRFFDVTDDDFRHAFGVAHRHSS